MATKLPYDVSLCAACTKRQDHLLQALDTWDKIPFKEIVLVSWEYNDTLVDKIPSRYHGKNIVIAEVQGKRYHDKTKASNLKVSLATSDVVLSTDCDILLEGDFLEKNIIDGPFFFNCHRKVNGIGTAGTFLFRREWFNQVGGYDERMEGWGFDDNDLMIRLKALNLEMRYLNPETISHIPHSTEIRTENYKEKNLSLSRRKNKSIVETKGPWSKDNKKEVVSYTLYKL